MRRLGHRLRSLALRVRRGWNTAYGKWAGLLGFLAVVTMLRGQNYLHNGIPSGSTRPIEFLSGVVHPIVWSALYIVAGFALLTGVVWRHTFAYGAAGCAVLWCLWGSAFIVAAIEGQASSGAHVTGLGFIGLGLCIGALAADEVRHDSKAVSA